ncbi:thioredoxin family protein [Stieleria sp.]|uniref:thioredoxin family protein n=1 Tax=Stieleria sp. TaxID=2795976 RepID=UPI0035633066
MKRFMVCTGQYALLAIVVLFAVSHCTAHAADLVGNYPHPVGHTVSSAESAIQWHEDLDAGWRAAKQSGRPMVIFITSSRCRYCDAMKRDTWTDGTIRSRLKNGFVAIRLSPDRNAEVLRRIDVPAYPTTLIGHPDGKVLAHKVGYQPPGALHQLLGAADQSAN